MNNKMVRLVVGKIITKVHHDGIIGESLELENGSIISISEVGRLVVSPPTKGSMYKYQRIASPFEFVALPLRWRIVDSDSHQLDMIWRGQKADSPLGLFQVTSFYTPQTGWSWWRLSAPGDIYYDVDSLQAGKLKAQQLFNDQLHEIAKYMEVMQCTTD